MTGFAVSLVSFLVAIAILVTVHEWGHFIVARLMGVKVLRFSIGFGRVLYMKRSGPDQTEYCLSAIPFGGYVKLLDERDCDVSLNEQGKAFNRKPVPARIAILVAGPLLNFLFAILAYWCVFMIGVPGVKPVIGDVTEPSIAATAGIEAGDRIVGIGERDIATWEGAVLAMLDELLSDGDIPMRVADKAGNQHFVLLPTAGMAPELTEPGQLLTGIGIQTWSPKLLPIIDKLTPNGPAEKAGLLTGDKIVEADGTPVNTWSEWVDYVRARPSEVVGLSIIRDGQYVDLIIEIGVAQEGDESIGRIGASVLVPADLFDEMQAEQRYGPVDALPAAVSRTWEMAALTVRMVGSMLTGDVSVKNISGPINIAQYAGLSASIGFVAFLNFLAIVSISLGILNLLPVPMLDGGHLVVFAVEGVRRRPLSANDLLQPKGPNRT
jgi:regulator of sigma E protease